MVLTLPDNIINNGLNDLNKSDKLSMNEYQQMAKETAIFDTHAAEEYLTYGILEEAGEIAGKRKRWFRGDYRGGNEDRYHDELKRELGDILWYIAMLADEHNWTLGDVAMTNYKKLKDRQGRGVIKGQGDLR